MKTGKKRSKILKPADTTKAEILGKVCVKDRGKSCQIIKFVMKMAACRRKVEQRKSERRKKKSRPKLVRWRRRWRHHDMTSIYILSLWYSLKYLGWFERLIWRRSSSLWQGTGSRGRRQAFNIDRRLSAREANCLCHFALHLLAWFEWRDALCTHSAPFIRLSATH